MSYFSWSKRPPREFRGKPQWTLDELYISPFTARRRYNEEGVMHYDPVERNRFFVTLEEIAGFLCIKALQRIEKNQG